VRYYILLFLSFLHIEANSTLPSWLDGKVWGNIRYYYIETNKNYIDSLQTSAHSNALGGQLHYTTNRLHGFQIQSTFMTTQDFLLPDNVESSTLGQDNPHLKLNPDDGYSVLGEISLDYKNKYLNLWYGRKVITTPMIGPKYVRMLPSAIQGSCVTFFYNKNLKFNFLYADKFKQRSSKKFTNLLEHALGTDTLSVTGKTKGETYTTSFIYNNRKHYYHLSNMYAPDFLNSFYFNVKLQKELYSIAFELVSQNSVGNAKRNLAQASSITNGKKINAKAIGFQSIINYKQSSFDLVYRKILRNPNTYDSIITPWDGSLLYAYSSTTNNLGQSLYGNALTAGGAYVGGTQGIKLGYTQRYNFLDLKGFKTHIAYAVYKNSLYREDQEDLKVIFFYDYKKVSLQLKGIWIDNDTYTFKNGTVNQLDSLTQFHAIATYKF